MAQKIKEGLKELAQGITDAFSREKQYAPNRLGESLAEQLRRATAKELPEPNGPHGAFRASPARLPTSLGLLGLAVKVLMHPAGSPVRRGDRADFTEASLSHRLDGDAPVLLAPCDSCDSPRRHVAICDSPRRPTRALPAVSCNRIACRGCGAARRCWRAQACAAPPPSSRLPAATSARLRRRRRRSTRSPSTFWPR
jgi:hypothetical protein